MINTGRRLGRPDILFWVLPYLIGLVIVGTIAQKTMGLYAAQNMFFSSFFFYWQGIPFPAGYLILGIISINLLCKFIFLSAWTKSKIGIHITHLSMVILLLGGLLTALSMQDGYLALTEGETGDVVRDYHNRVLTIDEHHYNFDSLETADFSALPLQIDILKTCANTSIRPRTDSNDGIGAASMAEIICTDPLPENEMNIAGVTYRISGADDGENGTYIAFESRQTTDEVMGLRVRLDRETRPLPFDVTLNRFQRDVYPGTNMPRDYESRVTITDGDVTWPAIIVMNEPLRYGGYTFYQASTSIDQNGQAVSVLSVVTNKGWIFPYISGILLAIGLIVHMVIRFKVR